MQPLSSECLRSLPLESVLAHPEPSGDGVARRDTIERRAAGAPRNPGAHGHITMENGG